MRDDVILGNIISAWIIGRKQEEEIKKNQDIEEWIDDVDRDIHHSREPYDKLLIYQNLGTMHKNYKKLLGVIPEEMKEMAKLDCLLNEEYWILEVYLDRLEYRYMRISNMFDE